MKCEIKFGDEKLRQSFIELRESSDQKLFLSLNRAFKAISENAFCGTQIPKRLIPKIYLKRYGELENLWKYNLPSSWRLIYSVRGEETIILGIILEWLPHKEYERRFQY